MRQAQFRQRIYFAGENGGATAFRAGQRLPITPTCPSLVVIWRHYRNI